MDIRNVTICEGGHTAPLEIYLSAADLRRAAGVLSTAGCKLGECVPVGVLLVVGLKALLAENTEMDIAQSIVEAAIYIRKDKGGNNGD